MNSRQTKRIFLLACLSAVAVIMLVSLPGIPHPVPAAEKPEAGTRARALSPGFCPDLPLVIVAATASPTSDTRDLFAVLVTGDGGWAGLDQDVATALAARGIPVVGWNSLRYFWHARTPEAAAADLERIILCYGRVWQRPKVLLIGYSFGADVLPFLYTRLPETVRASVRSVNLLGPDGNASFVIRITGWIPGGEGNGPAVRPEIERMANASILCLYGVEERDSPCPGLADGPVRAVAVAGGHHFGGDYQALARAIMEHALR